MLHLFILNRCLTSFSAPSCYTLSSQSIHTRFTSCALDDEMQELSNSGFDTSSSAILNRYGDLITRIALEIYLPPLSAPTITIPAMGGGSAIVVDAADAGAHYINAIGFAIFDSITVEIGGSTIDQLYSDYAFIFEELAGRPGLRLEEAIGRVPYSSEVDEDLLEKSKQQQILYVPLPLWISKYQPNTWGLALPIVALSYHDVRVKVQTRKIDECVAVIYKDAAGAWMLSDLPPLNATTGTALVNSDLRMRLMVTSVYLDTVERLAMTAVTHSFLINVAQRQTHSIAANQSTKVENKLFANHPSTSLIWIIRPLNWNTAGGRRRYSVGYKDRMDFSSMVPNSITAALPYGDSTDPILSASLSLNSHDRWPADMPSIYFRTSVPYTSWRTMPSTPIYSYAFALEAATWQPTSTLNFSRLDHVSLGLTYAPGIQASEMFTINECYNLLLIKDGLGGVKFSN